MYLYIYILFSSLYFARAPFSLSASFNLCVCKRTAHRFLLFSWLVGCLCVCARPSVVFAAETLCGLLPFVFFLFINYSISPHLFSLMVLCGLHEKKNKHKKKKKKPTGGKTCFCVSFPPRLLDRLFSFDLPLRRRRRRRWLISDAVLVALAGSASRNKKQNNQSEIVLFSFRVKTKEAAASSYYTVTTIYAIRNRWHFDIYLKMQFSLPPPPYNPIRFSWFVSTRNPDDRTPLSPTQSESQLINN